MRRYQGYALGSRCMKHNRRVCHLLYGDTYYKDASLEQSSTTVAHRAFKIYA